MNPPPRPWTCIALVNWFILFMLTNPVAEFGWAGPKASDRLLWLVALLPNVFWGLRLLALELVLESNFRVLTSMPNSLLFRGMLVGLEGFGRLLTFCIWDVLVMSIASMCFAITLLTFSYWYNVESLSPTNSSTSWLTCCRIVTLWEIARRLFSAIPDAPRCL